MYHRISEPTDSSLAVSPESFERQIAWLQKKNFHFLSLSDVVNQSGKIPLTDRSIALTFDDGFQDNEKALSLLLSRRLAAALFVVVNWVGQNGFMSWRRIRELSEAGITIGSHSLTHRWPPHILDSQELEREIRDSKKKIEDETGKKVDWFSYPVGGVDERVAECVKKAGYRAAWVAGARPTVEIKDPLLSLRRVKISPSDHHLWRFAVKAYGMRGMKDFLLAFTNSNPQ